MNDSVGIPSVEAIIRDPAASFWLKSNLETALERDPVDALNDAILLAALLDQRLRDKLGLDEIY